VPPGRAGEHQAHGQELASERVHHEPLSETTVVQPDLIFLDSARSSLATARGIEGPPTLAVEIVSRSTAQVDRGAKLQLSARHGIAHYWIVDPAMPSIEASTLTGAFFRWRRASAALIAVHSRLSRA